MNYPIWNDYRWCIVSGSSMRLMELPELSTFGIKNVGHRSTIPMTVESQTQISTGSDGVQEKARLQSLSRAHFDGNRHMAAAGSTLCPSSHVKTSLWAPAHTADKHTYTHTHNTTETAVSSHRVQAFMICSTLLLVSNFLQDSSHLL